MKIENESKLTHVIVKGEAQMVDVSYKDITIPRELLFPALKLFIMGKKYKDFNDFVSAKQHRQNKLITLVIPLCHNINVTHACSG